MKLYLLQPVTEWRTWYDKAAGFVVSAESEEDARHIVTNSGQCGDERRYEEVWLDPSKTKCTELAKRTTSDRGVVLCDFRSA